jgi:hypothetical protein
MITYIILIWVFLFVLGLLFIKSGKGVTEGYSFMNYDVVEVQLVEHLHLKVKFRDGLSGEVLFKECQFNGYLKDLQDPDVFSKVNCENGFIEWPGGIYLAPDAMYDAIKKKGVCVLA